MVHLVYEDHQRGDLPPAHILDSIGFVIRLRKKNYKEAVNAAEGKKYSAMEKKVLKSRIAGKALGKKILLQEQSFSFVVLENPKPDASEPLIYLLSTLDEAPGKIAAHYPIRWQIETCRVGPIQALEKQWV